MKGIIVQASCSLSRAAPLLHRAIHSGTRPASTAASKLRVERPLTSEEIYTREDKYGAHNYHPLPVALERGQGEFIFSQNVKNLLSIIRHFARTWFSLLQASMCGMWRAAGIMTS